MKLRIPDTALQTICRNICQALPPLIAQSVVEFNEAELVSELQKADAKVTEKILAYLRRTELNCTHATAQQDRVLVPSETVRKMFGIHPHSMAEIRRSMEYDQTISTTKKDGRLAIMFFRQRQGE